MPPESFDPLQTESLADQTYTRLRRAVGDGSMRSGEKITERDLARRLNISPTPVREALRQLLRDRIVERTGPRSLQVAEYDAGTVRELAEVEARLRGMAARLAARKRDPALVGELTADLDEADGLRDGLVDSALVVSEERLATLLAVLRRFHARIERAAANPVLEALLDQSRVYGAEERLVRTADRIRNDRERFAGRYAEHRRIVDAIARGAEDEAEQLVTGHHLSALVHLSS